MATTDIASLVDKVVVIAFREPVDANGYDVKKATGTFGGADNGFFALNDIQAAFDVGKVDVTVAAGLSGATIVGLVDNISVIVSGK